MNENELDTELDTAYEERAALVRAHAALEERIKELEELRWPERAPIQETRWEQLERERDEARAQLAKLRTAVNTFSAKANK